MLRFAPLLLPLALANCGAILASIELAGRVDEAERLEALIATADESDLAAISDDEINQRRANALQGIADGNPDAGMVRYNGQAAMEVPQGNNTLILSGLATIDANFANDTISADFSDWLGYNDGDTLANTASGDVVFSNGVIGDEDAASNISGDVNGTLTFKGDEYSVDGVIDGQFATFQGSEGVGGVTLDDQTTITMNGEVVPDAQFGFAGEIAD
ncbi:hypothetical protein [Flavimaricola marinus]|uniref:Transferrin-binding protein B C-lobe/N-lobe beta barrel domain-containing protein n=1 Tax=Flavimaricola marinus TaxID=1819565 RepID=A0A238LE01_9RHOB|nr:hypothetical protein [Flavimaricola marinus]SMY07812.1 hypothetical protein LOM8899_01952 [Flavimaricola marinus]